MKRVGRRGFTLIEVLASFAIAVILIVPVARIIHGVAGSFAGLERSTERRVGMQSAMAAAMTVNPLRPGSVSIGDFAVTITPLEFAREDDLKQSGWQLYAVRVTGGAAGTSRVETVRLGKRL